MNELQQELKEEVIKLLVLNNTKIAEETETRLEDVIATYLKNAHGNGYDEGFGEGHHEGRDEGYRDGYEQCEKDNICNSSND